MVQQQAFEGTGEELQEHLKQHPYERFRLILLASSNKPSEQTQHSGLQRGMFPQLRGLTDEDFKAAEWQDKEMGF